MRVLVEPVDLRLQVPALLVLLLAANSGGGRGLSKAAAPIANSGKTYVWSPRVGLVLKFAHGAAKECNCPDKASESIKTAILALKKQNTHEGEIGWLQFQEACHETTELRASGGAGLPRHETLG